MNTTPFRPANRVCLVFAAALLPMLIGCVADSGSNVRVHASSGYARTDVMMEDDYVYYPGYEVYYSRNRHNYVYRDGRNWVTRPAPPRVSVDVLLASPSVHVDFRDAPERHHPDMIKRYPRDWRPPVQRDDDRHNDRDNDHKHN